MSDLENRPVEGEFPPYYSRYIGLLPDRPVLELLADQVEDTAALLDSIGEDRAGFRYAEGKWSVKEVVGHVIDVERIFAARALARTGTASGGTFAVAAMAWIIAGHEAHHLRVLRERYLPAMDG